MGLADDLTALQALRTKGEISESSYVAARDAVVAQHVAPTTTFRLSRFPRWRSVLVILIVAAIAWGLLKNRETGRSFATAARLPITLTDEVENVPAHSWKAVPLNLPYGGTLDVNLEVARGNPVDVFLTRIDQLEAVKKEDWNNVSVYTNFNALKTKTYRRTGELGQGSYYLVMRDTSLGILSSSASDIALKVQLSP